MLLVFVFLRGFDLAPMHQRCTLNGLISSLLKIGPLELGSDQSGRGVPAQHNGVELTITLDVDISLSDETCSSLSMLEDNSATDIN